jgi:hypothetical protein
MARKPLIINVVQIETAEVGSNALQMLPAFNCCRAGGWSNEPSLGSIETAA